MTGVRVTLDPSPLNLWRADFAQRPLGCGLPFDRVVPPHFRLHKIDYDSELGFAQISFGDAVVTADSQDGNSTDGYQTAGPIWKRVPREPVVKKLPAVKNSEALTVGEVPTQYLDLEPGNARILELIKGRPGIGRQYARSAVRHMNLAFKLIEIDLDMAWFRAYMSREEAAKAIHFALVRRKYLGANKLKPTDHLQMLAITSFIRVLGEWFYSFVRKEMFPNPADGPFLHYDKPSERWELSVRFPGMPPGMFANPVPPLDFYVTRDTSDPVFHNFVESLTNKARSESFEAYVKSDFALRNHVLYASEKGLGSIAQVNGNQRDIWKNEIVLMIIGYLLIDMHKEKQGFVQLCLDQVLDLYRGFDKVRYRIT